MRIRTVKPDFWTDSTMVQLPVMARLLFIGLWTCADDEGYFPYEPDQLAMQVLPREDETEVESSLDLLIACGRVEVFVCDDGNRYLKIANWEKHQKIDRPTKSKIFRESSRKLAIPQDARRAVATKYGCEPGKEKSAACYFCGCDGKIHWMNTSKGKPSAWVCFSGLELAHFVAEAKGGESTEPNLVLACRKCNRSMTTSNGVEFVFSTPHERSRVFALERKGKEGNGMDQGKEITAHKSKCTLEEIRDFALSIGLEANDGETMWHKWESNGWINGRNKVKDWKAVMRQWKAGGYHPSQKRGGNQPKKFAGMEEQIPLV